MRLINEAEIISLMRWWNTGGLSRSQLNIDNKWLESVLSKKVSNFRKYTRNQAGKIEAAE